MIGKTILHYEIHKKLGEGGMGIVYLAQIYALTGEADSALKIIEELLSYPTDVISVALLELNPVWDPLRELPEYTQMISKQPVGN